MNGYFLRNNQFTVVCILLITGILGCEYKPSNLPDPIMIQGMLDLKNMDILLEIANNGKKLWMKYRKFERISCCMIFCVHRLSKNNCGWKK